MHMCSYKEVPRRNSREDIVTCDLGERDTSKRKTSGSFVVALRFWRAGPVDACRPEPPPVVGACSAALSARLTVSRKMNPTKAAVTPPSSAPVPWIWALEQ